jgi:hypothetical protein
MALDDVKVGVVKDLYKSNQLNFFLSSSGENYSRKAMVVQPLSDKGYHNLLSSATNAQWRLIRKAVMPVFNFGSLK